MSAICDFCSDPEALWNFGCHNFKVPDTDNALSLGDWLACDQCASLIDAERWRDLAEVCVAKTNTGRILAEMIGREGATLELMKLHSEFRKYRFGKARRI